ncbi:MAG: hypothetical protein HRT72_00255 [Flavobacteriales bacterium]|nr:hypothetical protein [Flavobacteriales bacterium]
MKTISTKNIFYLLLVQLAVFLAVGCASEEGGAESEEAVSEEEAIPDVNKDELIQSSSEKIFYAIPSPIEMAAIIKKTGATYSGDILNDVKNVDNYSTNSSKALNLGIYGADLSYTSIFGQTQESMLYFSCAKKLADGLGITSAFSAENVYRIQQNLGNKDTLVQIISESYWSSESYLKENDRADVSAVIVTGGWIEGLYIAAQLALQIPDNNEILERVAEQKLSLEDLIKLLENFNDEDLNALKAQLAELSTIFEAVDIKIGENNVELNEESKVHSITTKSEILIPNELLGQIADKVGAIRSGIVN